VPSGPAVSSCPIPSPLCREQLAHTGGAALPVQVLHLRKLRRRSEQVARAFDELVLLRRREAGKVQGLLGDRHLALLATLQTIVNLDREHRHCRKQHQDQKAKTELHRHPAAAGAPVR
jgi:hypothetical protein